ncbi:MAG: hypothetical protein AAF674_18630 [Pseudomonadota bacterium]
MRDGHWRDLAGAWRLIRRGLREKIAPTALADPAALADFLGQQSAKVAQGSLFGYLKTRMGTQSRDIFQNPVFAEQISIAQGRVFHGCLSDLGIFALANVQERVVSADDLLVDRAPGIYEAAVQAAEAARDSSALQAFTARVAGGEWRDVSDPDSVFATSAEILLSAAPVSDAFKQLDRAIVTASIRYRWIEVRRTLNARLDAEKLVESWRRRSGG